MVQWYSLCTECNASLSCLLSLPSQLQQVKAVSNTSSCYFTVTAPSCLSVQHARHIHIRLLLAVALKCDKAKQNKKAKQIDWGCHKKHNSNPVRPCHAVPMHASEFKHAHPPFHSFPPTTNACLVREENRHALISDTT